MKSYKRERPTGIELGTSTTWSYFSANTMKLQMRKQLCSSFIRLIFSIKSYKVETQNTKTIYTETKELAQSHSPTNIDIHQRKHFRNENTKKSSYHCRWQDWLKNTAHKHDYTRENTSEMKIQKNSLAFSRYPCRWQIGWKIQCIGMICHTQCS